MQPQLSTFPVRHHNNRVLAESFHPIIKLGIRGIENGYASLRRPLTRRIDAPRREPVPIAGFDSCNKRNLPQLVFAFFQCPAVWIPSCNDCQMPSVYLQRRPFIQSLADAYLRIALARFDDIIGGLIGPDQVIRNFQILVWCMTSKLHGKSLPLV
jgi:hypothetical protein